MSSYTLRAARCTPFVVMACIAGCYLAARRSVGHDPDPAIGTMRVDTLLLAFGCCAVLDDPAALLLAASPTRLWRRRVRQAAVTLVPAGTLWLTAFIMIVPRSYASAATTGLALEAAALIAMVCTVALVCQRFGVQEPSPVVGSVTVAVGLTLIALPHSISLFTTVDDPAWAAAHHRWTAILAGLAVIGACAVRDPASRRFHRLAQRRSPDQV